MAEFANYTSSSASSEGNAPSSSVSSEVSVAPTQSSRPEVVAQGGSRVFISPLAKGFAAENKVDITQIKGSGIEGSVVKADVEKYLAKPG